MTTPACQLYLVLPVDTPDATARLTAALAGGHVACLLLTAGGGEAIDPAKARPLIKLAQARGVAALVADDAVNAKLLGADGVHLASDPYDYDAARRLLGPRAIVGVEVGLSRHDAMELGERGADYVAFCETGEDIDGEDVESDVAPVSAAEMEQLLLDAVAATAHDDDDAGDDDEPDDDKPDDDELDLDEDGGLDLPLPDRIAWWAEVFTVPCVAWDVIMPEEAAAYALFGADFVALAPEAWLEATDPGRVIDAFAEAVAAARSLP